MVGKRAVRILMECFLVTFEVARSEWTLKQSNNASEYHIRCTISLIKFQLWKWKWIEVQNELNPYEASSECATLIFADRFSLKSSNETDIRSSVKPYTPDSGYGQYFVPALCKSGQFFSLMFLSDTDYTYRRRHWGIIYYPQFKTKNCDIKRRMNHDLIHRR